jgi:hypothetical protein
MLVIEKGIPLTEINKWDLEDIEKAYNVYAMIKDNTNAGIELKKKEMEPKD